MFSVVLRAVASFFSPLVALFRRDLILDDQSAHAFPLSDWACIFFLFLSVILLLLAK